MVEWGRLLSGYWGEILSRRFESCPPRQRNTLDSSSVFLFLSIPLVKLIFLPLG